MKTRKKACFLIQRQLGNSLLVNPMWRGDADFNLFSGAQRETTAEQKKE